MSSLQNPQNNLRTAKVIFFLGLLLLISSAFAFMSEKNQLLGEMSSFVFGTFAILGLLFLFVAFAGYAKASRKDASSVSSSSTKDASGPRRIIFVFTTLVVVLFVTPFVLRLMYHVPILTATAPETRDALLSDPHFVGCIDRPLDSRLVICRGTGFDELLSFLMKIPRRATY